MLERGENDLVCAREGGDIDAGLQAQTQAHRREIGIAARRSLVASWPEKGVLSLADCEAQGVMNSTGRDVIVVDQPWQNGKSRRVRRSPGRRSQGIGVEIP